MAVHLMRPRQQLLEPASVLQINGHVLLPVHPNAQRNRGPDRAPQRVATPDPVPEPEHVVRCDPKLLNRLCDPTTRPPSASGRLQRLEDKRGTSQQ
eukprot:3457588-Rhodomonas_salina.2